VTSRSNAAMQNGVILDACQVLNLFASRRMDEILHALDGPAYVSEHAATTEALWVGTGRRGEPNSEYEVVDLAPTIARGYLRVIRPETESELDDFVRLATLMDDGEAMAGALAFHRALVVGTDDRRAIGVFQRLSPPIRTIGTCAIVHTWASRAGAMPTELCGIVTDIRRRARFLPPAGEALREWWNAALVAA